MNALLAFFRGLRTDYRRWQNRRQRAKRVVYTWPRIDQRNWSDDYMRTFRHG